jgi:hypothetical protein
MNDVPEPNFDDARSAPLRRVFLLFGRGIVYALAFWMVHAAIYRAPWSATSTSKDEEERTEQAWKAHDLQQARAAQSMAAYEIQQKRMDAVITKQEELMLRFEAVIAGWEKQPVAKR